MSKNTFDENIPNIVLDKEDRDAFHRNRKSSNTPESGSKNNEPEHDSGSGNKGGGSKALTFLVLIIALAACGASYWLYQQKLAQDAALSNAADRISDLERRLSATGEEIGQSAVALQVKVTELNDKTDELWVQMDKLWASAWRRNQADIESLTKKTTSQATVIKNQLSVIEGEMNLAGTNLALLQELNQSIGNLQTDNNSYKNQISDLQSKVLAASQVNAALTRRIAELEKSQRASNAAASTP
jgi:cell division protein FtsL